MILSAEYKRLASGVIVIRVQNLDGHFDRPNGYGSPYRDLEGMAVHLEEFVDCKLPLKLNESSMLINP